MPTDNNHPRQRDGVTYDLKAGVVIHTRWWPKWHKFTVPFRYEPDPDDPDVQLFRTELEAFKARHEPHVYASIPLSQGREYRTDLVGMPSIHRSKPNSSYWMPAWDG